MMRGSNQCRYYGNGGYFNSGTGAAGAKSQREASEALVDRMVARIANRTGRIELNRCAGSAEGPPSERIWVVQAQPLRQENPMAAMSPLRRRMTQDMTVRNLQRRGNGSRLVA